MLFVLYRISLCTFIASRMGDNGDKRNKVSRGNLEMKWQFIWFIQKIGKNNMLENDIAAKNATYRSHMAYQIRKQLPLGSW